MGPSSATRRDKHHPTVPELVGGVNLSVVALRAREEAADLAALIELFGNAEYWLSFDLAGFEPMLLRAPSPIRELGVGLDLRFGEAVDGRLCQADLEQFRRSLSDSTPDDVADGIARAADTLERMIDARDAMAARADEGYEVYNPQGALSVHAMRAHGSAHIHVEPVEQRDDAMTVKIGEPIQLSATSERGKALEPPGIESLLDAPVLVKSDPLKEDLRFAIFVVPGWYTLRVPGKLDGERKLLAC